MTYLYEVILRLVMQSEQLYEKHNTNTELQGYFKKGEIKKN